MWPNNRTRGFALVDVMAGLAVFVLVTAGIYQVFIPFLSMARSTSERLAVQQDVRLAMDRMARDLRESTAAPGRLVLYGGGTAIGLVSARPSCTGAFTVDAASGRPLWQAMIYVVRDASEEVRAYCDTTSTFADVAPVTTGPFRILARNVQALTFTQSPTFDSVTIEMHERTPRGDADRHIRTEFVPQND